MSSSVFDSPCPSVSSVSWTMMRFLWFSFFLKDKPDAVIVLDNDDGSDIEIDEQSNPIIHENGDHLIEKLDVNTEVILVKPNLPIQISTTTVAYPNLQDIHIIKVKKKQSRIIYW